MSLDVEVLDIGRRDLILVLFWLEKYGFSVDTIRKQLVRKDSFKISCWEKKIGQIIVIEGKTKEEDTVLLFDAAFHYANYA